MALDAWLSEDWQFQRNSSVNEDAYGNAKSDWYDVATVPGRLVEKRQHIWSDERKESLVVSNMLLLVPASADAQERDRAVRVADGETYTVTGILMRRARAAYHLSLSVERVT